LNFDDFFFLVGIKNLIDPFDVNYSADFEPKSIAFFKKSVIFTRRVLFHYAECNFYTQSLISIGMTLTSVILYAECDFYTQCVISTLRV
jgi:hypothetical protein